MDDMTRRIKEEADKANIELIEAKAEIARLTAVIEQRHATVAGRMMESAAKEVAGPVAGSVGDDTAFLGRVIAAAVEAMDVGPGAEWEGFVAYIDALRAPRGAENSNERLSAAWNRSIAQEERACRAEDALIEVRGCFDAATCEGLVEVLAETTDERLKDLVKRRLMHAYTAACNVEISDEPAARSAENTEGTTPVAREVAEKPHLSDIEHPMQGAHPDEPQDGLVSPLFAGPATQQEITDDWLPIETAPTDGTYIILGSRAVGGSWVGKYVDQYQSGFRPDNHWVSMMLNSWHLPPKHPTLKPTHWMPLPAAPGDQSSIAGAAKGGITKDSDSANSPASHVAASPVLQASREARDEGHQGVLSIGRLVRNAILANSHPCDDGWLMFATESEVDAVAAQVERSAAAIPDPLSLPAQQGEPSGPAKATNEQALAGYAVACKFGVYENRAFTLADEMFAAFAAAAAAPVPQANPNDEQRGDTFCWLVELRPSFEGHPAFPATYYSGWMDGPMDAATTQDPYASPRFTRKADAERVAKQLGHTLSCTWEAVEHGFHDSPTAAPSPENIAQAAPGEVQLRGIRAALIGYYDALTARQHGGVAQDRAFQAIERTMQMSWEDRKAQQAGAETGAETPKEGV